MATETTQQALTPERAAKLELLAVYEDIRELVDGYTNSGEYGAIPAMAFGADLQQLFIEKYGVTLP